MRKKLLISDYDGTFKCDDKDTFMKNIYMAREFMRKGNFFNISTARGFDSIKQEIDNYKISCNFITCNNGSVIYDASGNLLYANYLNIDDLRYIKNVLQNYDLHYLDDRGNDVNKMDNIVDVSFLSLFGISKDIKERLNQFQIDKRSLYVYLIKNWCSKLDGAKYIQNLLEIKDDCVYAIGDSIDEKELLLNYNGYRVPTAYPCLYVGNIKPVENVYKLVYKINEKM